MLTRKKNQVNRLPKYMFFLCISKRVFNTNRRLLAQTERQVHYWLIQKTKTLYFHYFFGKYFIYLYSLSKHQKTRVERLRTPQVSCRRKHKFHKGELFIREETSVTPLVTNRQQAVSRIINWRICYTFGQFNKRTAFGQMRNAKRAEN